MLRWAAFLWILFALPSAVLSEAPAQFVVIVNSENTIRQVGMRQLRQLYQGARRSWPNRSRVEMVVPAPGDPARAFLAGKVLRVAGDDELKRFYLRAVFRQELPEPPAVLSGADAVAYVHENPGAIALLDPQSLSAAAGVKVIPISDD